MPAAIVRRIADAVYLDAKRSEWDPWAVHEVSKHDWVTIAQAGGSLATFDSRPWLHQIDVPTSVIMTTADTIVPPRRQQILVDRIPDVDVHAVDGNHDSCFARADTFGPALIAALQRAATART
jgi:3-oxoadipate enol-lactonase